MLFAAPTFDVDAQYSGGLNVFVCDRIIVRFFPGQESPHLAGAEANAIIDLDVLVRPASPGTVHVNGVRVPVVDKVTRDQERLALPAGPHDTKRCPFQKTLNPGVVFGSFLPPNLRIGMNRSVFSQKMKSSWGPDLWYHVVMSTVVAKPSSINRGKRKAAQEFTRQLLDSEVGRDIASILLIGSVIRDEAQPESDVDVLVFGDKINPQKVEAIADLAWETTMATGEFIAPLAYNLQDLFEPRNYFLFDAIRHGVELYRMEEKKIRFLEAQNLYRKADVHLDEAKRALSQQAFHLALVGAYTSAELSAKALLYLKPNVDIPSKHGSIVRVFSREYALTGEVPSAWGRSLNRELETRSRALYDTAMIIKDREKPEAAIEFAQEVLAYLGEKLSDDQVS